MATMYDLIRHGQSYWLDNLTREMIDSGALAKRVREEGLRGLTSNPAIFHKAISKGAAYDSQISELVAAGAAVEEIYEGLVVTDIRGACDLLRPVFDESAGVDGYVSLEVSPHLIHDTRASLQEARRLWTAVDRSNLLIKIPGTPAGVPAIEELLFEGINVNVTLLFSIPAYEQVALAYLRALERRRDEGLPLQTIASVASFFISRIDTLLDQLLSHRIGVTASDGVRAQGLLGKAGIASAKLAYRSHSRLFGDDRWRSLADAGAHVQRLLWASTSTKNPLYDPVRYVEPLIGPDTVNTMPEATVEAFVRKGRVVGGTIEADVESAARVFEDLAELGIDIAAVTEQLIGEGAQKFIEPFDALMEGLAAKRAVLVGDTAARQTAPLPVPAEAETLAALHEARFVRRLFDGDPSLWTSDPAVAKRIAARLGWTRVDRGLEGTVSQVLQFADEIRSEGTRHVVVLGMGGSSLCPLVIGETFGSREGWPELLVLDQVDPGAVESLERRIDPMATLFLVASKSGTTIETLSLYRYFRSVVERAGGDAKGSRFVALTDPGTPLQEEARAGGFRKVFETPTDVGGRYSALTAFGLLPMALAGVDVEAVLGAARLLRKECSPVVPEAAIPAIRLGALLARGALEGRDKLSLSASASIATLPLWIEQLVAESTGKEGIGIVPLVGEPWASAPEYRNDRLFVHTRLVNDPSEESDARLDELRAAGHPVVVLTLPSREALGGEFLRWEIATAAAGALLRLNPFDEPDVAKSKRHTATLLSETARRPADPPLLTREGVEVYVDRDLPWAANLDPSSLESLLGSAFAHGDESGYVALLGFFASSHRRDELLAELRKAIRRRCGAATSFGYGPRYLHSTGQLHKGGPDTGLFLLLTADAPEEITVPGETYGFAALQRAQALGDYRALQESGRRVIRVHLGWYVEEALTQLREAISVA